ncbi:Uu.00g096730.m01.CDS01 [Anthostomella pinea]|uniref:Uu.00g096730.m01.CDS01 n=1 Tax=Anthostomella pinea TaxID=933095 RepID=A0AAI8VCA3_9PEZI|nr:Uu.00g096730.m01.CDS01 [Anthostomella pinea]
MGYTNDTLDEPETDEDVTDQNYLGGTPKLFDMPEFLQPQTKPMGYRDRGLMPRLDPEAWDSPAIFIANLPGLKDLVWNVWAHPNQMPSCILAAVHALGCRLHMHTFSIRNLRQDPENHDEPHPDDLALATSPSLHSIVAHRSNFASPTATDDYPHKAIFQMMAGAAPRLAHVWMRSVDTLDARGLQETTTLTRSSLVEFFPVTEVADQGARGSLKGLVMREMALNYTSIDPWIHHTDFANLVRRASSKKPKRASTQRPGNSCGRRRPETGGTTGRAFLFPTSRHKTSGWIPHQ